MTLRTRAVLSLFLPPLAWYAFQQGLSHVVHVACGSAGPVGALWGSASLMVCLVAAAIARKRADSDLISTYPWLCRIALLGAAVFALVIAFQTLAALMVPACVQ